MSLTELVLTGASERAAIRSLLDGMNHAGRVHATRALPRRLQGRLFDLLAGGDPLRVEDLMPAELPAGSVVRHHGVNSLPLFRIFQKPMYRSEEGVVGGRNVQPWAWFTGHGYFVVTGYPEGDPEREVLIDYTQLPPSRPEGWPPIRSNGRLFSRFVYHRMTDVMRRASEHVTVGKAIRGGEPFGSYFILVREDPGRALAGGERRALPPPTP
ncbi:MAG: hypothetical protein P1V51_05965 [Deltaproteobacteria bacterium]|nr:hypothetical protein [Deltaproteobacteria bacterium]